METHSCIGRATEITETALILNHGRSKPNNSNWFEWSQSGPVIWCSFCIAKQNKSIAMPATFSHRPYSFIKGQDPLSTHLTPPKRCRWAVLCWCNHLNAEAGKPCCEVHWSSNIMFLRKEHYWGGEIHCLFLSLIQPPLPSSCPLLLHALSTLTTP